MWNTLQMNKGDLSVTYRLSGEKKKVWKNHLSLLQKAFYILFLLCIIFWVASFQTDHNFLWGQRLLFLKNAIIIKIMIILWHDLYWSSLTLVHMLRSFVEFLPGAENLTKKKHNSASCCTWVWNISDIVVKWPATLKTALRRKKRWWWCPTKEKQRFRAEEIQRNFETLVVGAQRLSSIPAFLGLCSSLNHQRLVHHSKSSQQQFLYVITSSL